MFRSVCHLSIFNFLKGPDRWDMYNNGPGKSWRGGSKQSNLLEIKSKFWRILLNQLHLHSWRKFSTHFTNPAITYPPFLFYL